MAGGILVGFILGLLLWIKTSPQPLRHFTHLELDKDVVKQGVVEVFYPTANTEEKRLAEQICRIVAQEYDLISQALGLKQEDILSFQPYSLVICDNFDDPLLTKLKDGLISIDTVLCWPVVSERGLPFKDTAFRFRLCYTLPAELCRGIIETKLKLDKNSTHWFVRGVSGYVAFLCWQAVDRKGFFNYEYTRVLSLYEKDKVEERRISLLDRNSFASLGLLEEPIFCSASTFLMIDLVKKHGQEIIPAILNRLTKVKGKIEGIEIVKIIESLTGERLVVDISVQETQARFKGLKEKRPAACQPVVRQAHKRRLR